MRLWQAATGSQRAELVGHVRAVTSAAFTPDGTRLATVSEDQTVKVWDVAAGEEVLTLTGHTAPITAVPFGPDGCVLSAGADGAVLVT